MISVYLIVSVLVAGICTYALSESGKSATKIIVVGIIAGCLWPGTLAFLLVRAIFKETH